MTTQVRNEETLDELTGRQRLIAGAACCASGASLVVHILTGSPLWLVFTVFGFGSAAAIAIIALSPAGARTQMRTLLRRGMLVGLVGTAAYDASRWLLVQVGGLELSPFEALPLFGRALLGENRSGTLVEIAGTGYHLVNGVTFGIAFVIWFGHRQWWWGIVFALALEAFMLALYPGWLDPKSIAELTQVSMVGHFAYGATLGLTAKALTSRTPATERRTTE